MDVVKKIFLNEGKEIKKMVKQFKIKFPVEL